MSSLTITITEEDRQAMLLALAKLALENPGWDQFLSEIADKLACGRDIFDGFKLLHKPTKTEERPCQKQK